MTREGSAARLVRNTLANGAGSLVAVAISLVMTPFLLDGLGAEGFGVWALALSLSFIGGYASLTDLGIEAAAARFVAEARADRDADALNRVASGAMAVFGVLAVVLTPVLVALAPLLVDLFDVSAGLRDAATLTFALVAGQLLFEMPARVFFAVLEGAQRFVLFQAVELLRALTLAVGFVLTLVGDVGVAGLGVSTVAASAVVLVVAAVLARRAVPGLRVSPRLVDRAGLRRLVGFGAAMFLSRLVGTLYRQMDKVVVGVALGARPVAFYEVANRIFQGAAMVQSIAASALVPATAHLRRQPEVLRGLYLSGTRYTLAATLPVVVSGVVLAPDLVRTWTPGAYPDAARPAQVFLASLLFVGVHVIGATMVAALGKLRFMLTVGVLNLLLNLVLSVILVGPYGVTGVVVGTLVAQASAFPPLLHLFLRTFGIGRAEWWRATVLPVLPAVAAQALVAWPVVRLAGETDRLVVVAVLVLAHIAVAIGVFLRFGLPAAERAGLARTVRLAVGGDGRPTRAGR